MESIRSTIRLLFPNCVMAGIDLKDAYYHLPIHNRFQKYLRVAVEVEGRIRHFQYAAMPFGLSTAPRIFTKVMAEVMAYLRQKNTLIVPYLDDFLIIGNSVKQCTERVTDAISSFQSLGWIINIQKSRLDPQSLQTFLGFQLDSLTQRCLLPQLQQKHVRILSDNTTTVAYINKQGGTRSETLMSSAARILNLAENYFLSLSALHIRGESNQKADFLSRHTLRQGEWCLNQKVFRDIVALWGQPEVDLFATKENRQIKIFASLSPSDHPDILDALLTPWNFNLAYAFPPLILLPQVIRKIRDDKARIILIEPFWPKRPWFSWLQIMSITDPWVLPSTPNLLSQGPFFHPQVVSLHLTAWNLRGSY
ncbi:uncharacterized protein [Dendrobates tinctorius]|uniref:uncharacterized protein isoform X2 n=1 Tax=Dendrobates tinctorius TaxID=92724 RepID=UPI003CC9695C